MNSLIHAILALILILLASYITISYESNSYTLRTFTITDSQENTENHYTNLNTYTIPQEQSGYLNLINVYKQTQATRQRNLLYQQRDEEIEKCINKITKNWKRTYYKRSYEQEYDDIKEEWKDPVVFYEKESEFYGYNKDEDWDLIWRLRNRALNGKKIC